MKFISSKIVDGVRHVAKIPFDTEFIKDIKVEDDYDISFTYNLSDSMALFPINIQEALFVVKLTSNNILLSSVAFINNDDNSSFPFAEDGTIEYCITFSEYERMRLMLFLLQYLENYYIKNNGPPFLDNRSDIS